MANIGTLSALAEVFDRGNYPAQDTTPDLEDHLMVPFVRPPGLAVISCLYLMINLPTATWIRWLSG
jgi:hypothetical protein